MQFGRRTGLATALGFGLGIGFHVSYTLTGLAYLINEFPQIYRYTKYAGASYLIYLGLVGLRNSFKNLGPPDLQIKDLKTQGMLESFWQGFLTNILNPKAALFILGLFTSVIPTETSLTTLILLGLIMIMLTVLWFSLVTWLFSIQKIRIKFLCFEKNLNYIFSAFFIVIGFGLFFNIL